MRRGRIAVVARSATLALRQRTTLPQTLIFFVTARCNARCDFCLYKDSVENPTRRSEELTAAEVDQIARNYGPLHFLALSGGEPFVRRDIDTLCQSFIDHCRTSVIDIPSNFFYGDAMVEHVERLVSANPNVIVELQFSVDHLDGLHDQSRGVDGLFEIAIENFKRLEAVRRRHSNLSLKVNIVWLERNRDDIDAIVSGLRQRIDFDRIHLTYPHDEMSANGGDAATLADFDRFRVAAERLANTSTSGFDPYSIPMRAAKVSSHRVLRQALTGEASMGSVCEAGQHLVVIDERGEVFPCEVVWQSVGNLRDYDLDMSSVLAAPAYERFRMERLGPDRCNCTWSCAAMTAVSVTPTMYPKLAADAAKIAIARPTAS